MVKDSFVSKTLGFILKKVFFVMAWFYYLSPLAFKNFYGGSLGAFLRLIRFKTKIVRKNLNLTYPGSDQKSIENKKSIFIKNYKYFGTLVFEILLHFGFMKRFIQKNVIYKGFEHWEKAHQQGRGVILFFSHLGNWEVMTLGVSLKIGGGLAVTKQLKPQWLHDTIEKSRENCEGQMAYEPRVWKKVISALNKKGTVGFVLDQYVGDPIGVRVPYFGVPVGTNVGVATLVKRSQAVVLPLMNYRTKEGKYVIEFFPPVDWVKDPHPQKELALNTANYVSILERQIREHPEQWLWVHRRFKGDLSPLTEADWTEFRDKKFKIQSLDNFY